MRLARYHILRNRGYMAHYLQQHGDYHPVLFGIGTAATVAKEIIRPDSCHPARGRSAVRR